MYASHSSAQKKPKGRGYGKGKPTGRPISEITCFNCNRKGHKKPDCWEPGGGKEGQSPFQKSATRGESANVAQEVKEELFAFTCTSDHADVAEKLNIPQSKRGGVIDSGASRHFCYDRSKFINFTPIPDLPITTADRCTFKAIGTGDVRIDLPNGTGQTSFILKDAVYAPQMAFTLISIGCLTRAGLSVNFIGNICKIGYPNGRIVGTVPYTAGLYWLVAAIAGEPTTE